jgi:hypothetical protein
MASTKKASPMASMIASSIMKIPSDPQDALTGDAGVDLRQDGTLIPLGTRLIGTDAHIFSRGKRRLRYRNRIKTPRHAANPEQGANRQIIE